MKCNQCSNVRCENCQAKFNAWVIEAKQLKQDMLNGTNSGLTVSQGERNAFIAAAFTVLEFLDEKEAA